MLSPCLWNEEISALLLSDVCRNRRHGLLLSAVFVERGDEWSVVICHVCRTRRRVVCCHLSCLYNEEMSGLLSSVMFVERGDEWSVVICRVCRTRR